MAEENVKREMAATGAGAWADLEERRQLEAEISSKLAQEPILQFFVYEHLPGHLAEVSAGFSEQARRLVLTLPRNPERTVALRKLLEAKDAAVRARLMV